MSTRQFPDATQNGAGLVTADDAVSNSTAVLRDANGDIFTNAFRATKGFRSSGYQYFGISSQTVSFSVNEVANIGTVYLCDTTAGDITATLPAAASNTGKVITIKKTDATANGKVVIDANASELIDGALTFVLYRLYDQVTLQCDGTGWQIIGAKPSLLFAQVAASSAITGTLTETAFDQSFSIAANTLRAGDIIEINSWQRATSTNSTDTFKIKGYIGSTALFDTGALDLANDDISVSRVLIQFRTVGASGTLVAWGMSNIGTLQSTSVKSFYLASTAVDTTAALALTNKVTVSTTSGSNSIRQDGMTIERKAA